MNYLKLFLTRLRRFLIGDLDSKIEKIMLMEANIYNRINKLYANGGGDKK